METCNIALHVGSPHSYMATLEADEARWLREQLEAFWETSEIAEFECVDNARMATKGEEAHEAAYEEARNEGCCGSVDIDLGPSPLGRHYRYGFNHGH